MRKQINGAFVAFTVIATAILSLNSSALLAQSGTWSQTGNLTSPRTGAAAVLLKNGEILIAGGSDANGVPQASAEFFNPSTGTFSAAPAMNVPRANQAAIILSTGDVLVTGGVTDSGGDYTNSAEIFSVAAQQWMQLQASLPQGLAGHAMATLSDGNILIAGGESTTGPVGSLLLFNLSNDSITSIGQLLTARTSAVAAATPDGRVLIAGGTDINNNVLASTEIFVYTPTTIAGTISAGPAMSFARTSATATSTYDGVAIIGGYNIAVTNGQSVQTDLGSAEIFSQWTSAFKVVNGGTPRSGHFAVMLPNNGAILAMGGTGGTAVDLLQPWANSAAGAFIAGAPSLLNQAGGFASPASLGSLLAAGGLGTSANAAELYWFPTIATDRTEYAPGTTVVMTGTGYQPGETVDLHLHLWVNQTVTDLPDHTTTAGANGSFTFSGYAPNTTDIGAIYHLTAVGESSGFQAQTTFADAKNLTIDFAGTGAGSVVVTDTTTPKDSATCTGTCTEGLGNNDVGTLTATANPGSTFAGWSAQSAGVTGCSGNTCNFSLSNSAQSVTATFNLNNLAITSVNGGSNPAAGTPFSVVVQAQNGSGSALNVTANTNVTLSLNTGTGTLGGTLTGTITTGNSTVTISGVTYTKAQSGVILTATEASGNTLASGNSAPFTVGPGAASQLVFSTQPSGGTAGTAFGTQPVVTVEDANGNTVANSSASVILAITRGTGTAGATLSGTTTTNAVNGVATFSGLSINDVGNSYTLQATSGSLTLATSSAFNITTRAIRVTAATNTKTYDGTVSAAATPTITSGTLASGDTANFIEAYSSKNVGTGLTLTPSGTVTNGANDVTANYTITFVNNTTGVISARALTVTAATNTKTYDGTASAAAAPTITSGALQTGDTANFTESYSNKNAGVGNKTLIPTGTISDGNSGNNYTYTFVNFTTGTINSEALTVTAATNSKGYDGTASAAATPTITSGAVQSGDTANFTEAYSSKNVGTGLTLTPSGTVTDGNGGNNYTYTFVTNTTGVITARTITVTAATNTKVYDATTSAATTPTITAGTLASGDTASFTEAYASKNLGTGLTLTPSGSVSDGNSGNNYAVTFANNTTGVITAKTLTVTGITANNKTYDTTTAATLNTGSAALVGVVTGDNITLNTGAATGTFASTNVGTGITVTVSGLTITGTDAGNYSLTEPTTTANITQATPTVMVAGGPFTYNGNAQTATATATGVGGATVAGTFSFTYTPPGNSTAPTNAGTYSVSASFTSTNSNYSNATGTGSITINKATPVFSPALTSPASIPYGTATVSLPPNSPMVNAGGIRAASPDTVTITINGVSSGPISFNGTSGTFGPFNFPTSAIPPGSYTIKDTYSGNANLASLIDTSTTLTVTEATQTISFTAPTTPVTYGASSVALSASSTSGLSVSFTASGACSVSGSALSYTSAGTCTVTAAQAGNTDYLAATSVQKTVAVNQAPLVITASSATVAYGAAVPTITPSYATFVNGDTSSSLSTAPTCGTAYTPLSPAGSTPSTSCSGAVAANYSISYFPGTVTITAVAPVLPGPVNGGSTYGTSVTLTVTINSPDGGEVPTGNVQFRFLDPANSVTYNLCADGSLQAQTPTPPSNPCVVPLNSSGTAAVTTTNLPAGMAPDAITATYIPGDSNYLGGNTSINYTVSQASTQATLNILPAATPTYGDTVTLSSTVSDSTTGSSGTPTGTVQFEYSTDGGTTWINIGSAAALTPNADFTASATTSTTTLPAGTPSIKAVYSGDSNFIATNSGTTAYAVNPKNLTVSGITASDKPYDGSTAATLNTASEALVGVIAPDVVTLTGTATGAFTDPNAGSGKTVNITGQSLTGAQASNYTLTEPTATASITKVQLTVTAPSLSVTYGDPVPSLTPSITGFVNGEGTGALSAQPSCTTTYTQGSNAGSAQTTSCSGAAATNYSFAYVNGAVTVNKANATISVTPYNVTYDATAHTATATATGVGGVNLIADLTLNSSHTNAGNYSSDSWSFTDPTGNYNNVAATTITDVIKQATATLNVTPYSVTYDGTAHTATGTATGMGGVVLTGDLKLSGTTHSSAGDYPSDSWTFTDTSGNYNNATGTVHDVIGKAMLTITASSPTVNYGTPVPGITASYSGFVLGESSASLTTPPICTTVAHGPPSGSPAGTYASNCSGAVDNNYSISYTSGSVNIQAVLLTITASSGSMIYGGPVFPVTPSYSGFVNGDTTSSLASQPGCSTLATSSTPVGPYLSSCAGAEDSNYTIKYATGSVSVLQATTTNAVVTSVNPSTYMQMVTLAATVSPQYSGTTPTGTVTFYDTYNGNMTPLCSNVALSVVNGQDEATCSSTSLGDQYSNNITAVYAGDPNFIGSSSAALIQTVNPAPNVSLNPLSVSFGNQNVNTTSSPTAVTLANVGDAPLTISSNGISITPNTDFSETNNCGSSLAAGKSCTITITFTPVDTGIRTASLQITDNDDDASSAQQTVALTGSGLSTIIGTSLYTDALFATANGCGSIVASGGSTVDSFNSALGFNSSHQLGGGNVGTNGNVSLSGSKSTIYGSAAVDSTTTGNCNKTSMTGLTSSGGGQVTGGLIALNGPITYPAPPAPTSAPPTTTQNLSGSCGSVAGCTNNGSKSVSLAPGQFGNLTISGGTTAHFSKGVYNINSLTLSGQSILYVDAGPVVLNLAGASLSGSNPALDASGGSIQNPSGVPANLQITYAGSRGVNLTGGSGSYATIYAPGALVNMSGGSDFFGSIIASTVTNSGGTAIHYDASLPNIQAGNYIWFNAVVNSLQGLPSGANPAQVKLYLTDSTITFTANGTPYSVPVPNAIVTLNSTSASSPKTGYDLANSRWSTSVPASELTGNTFVTGIAIPVPASGFPNGIQNVSWSAAFSTDTPGITLQWQWGAAVYNSSFNPIYATSSNANVLGVNAEDGSADTNGTDPAGTPETYKAYVVFGATGGGLTNYTGFLSSGAGVVPTIAPMSVSPSSLAFGQQNQGTTSSALTAVITNNDSISHMINSITTTGTNASDFTVTNTCPTSLMAGAGCTITVTFTPSDVGTRTAKIVISDDAKNSPITVYLSGAGQ